jgi:dihydroorotase
MHIRKTLHSLILLALACASAFAQQAAPAYDLLLRGGHVLDDKNHIDGLMDVAIKDGKIAKVAAHIPSSSALKTVDVKGLYVTPGLIDIHVHVYAGTGERNSYAGDLSVPPAGGILRISRIASSIARRLGCSPC